MLAEPVSKKEALYLRAEMMQRVRAFFQERGVVEVDVPLLSLYGPVDPYIDLVTATCCGKKCYLHSSPEYGMKKLLAEGMGDCYQLSHVFRDFEVGEKHNPEFTMIEWYRKGYTLKQLMEETVELLSLFLPTQNCHYLSYEEAFYTYAGEFPQLIEERDELFAKEIEPKLEGLTFLHPYPPEQAMLAKVCKHKGELVAERFELFYEGIELGNGYLELLDCEILQKRLQADNEKRKLLGKEAYPIDPMFISAEIPECAGVAIGFDRLMMIKLQAKDIQEVVPFSFQKRER